MELEVEENEQDRDRGKQELESGRGTFKSETKKTTQKYPLKQQTTHSMYMYIQ